LNSPSRRRALTFIKASSFLSFLSHCLIRPYFKNYFLICKVCLRSNSFYSDFIR
jgi:hypothetical protein